jgi:hypothetical protein
LGRASVRNRLRAALKKAASSPGLEIIRRRFEEAEK